VHVQLLHQNARPATSLAASAAASIALRMAHTCNLTTSLQESYTGKKLVLKENLLRWS
jgi:hypothetical protein